MRPLDLLGMGATGADRQEISGARESCRTPCGKHSAARRLFENTGSGWPHSQPPWRNASAPTCWCSAGISRGATRCSPAMERRRSRRPPDQDSPRPGLRPCRPDRRSIVIHNQTIVMSPLRENNTEPTSGVCKPETGKKYDIYPTHMTSGRIRFSATTVAGTAAGRAEAGCRRRLCRRTLRPLPAGTVRSRSWASAPCGGASTRPAEEIERLVAPIWAATTRSSASAPRCGWRSFPTGKNLRAIAPEPRGGDSKPPRRQSAPRWPAGRASWVYRHPENEIQFRSRAGSIANLGPRSLEPPKKDGLDSIFVDWVVLNRHKGGAAAQNRHNRPNSAKGRSPGPRAPTCAAAWSTRRKRIPRPAVVRTRGVGEANGSANTYRRTATTCPITHGRSS